MEHLTLNRVIWAVAGLLAVVVASLGIANPAIYDGLVTDPILPGVFTQDLLAVPAGLLLLWLAARTRSEAALVAPLVAMGTLGYFFYAYGIYTIERVYNWVYPAYMALFALGFWGIVYGAVSLRRRNFDVLRLPNWLRRASVGYLFFNAVVFCALWMANLIPLMREHRKIEMTYSIFILDLCFIMPAFVMVGVMVLRGQTLGRLAIPPLAIAGFAILFPLGLAEALKPVVYGTPMEMGMGGMYTVLSVVFLGLAIGTLRALARSRRP